MILDHVLLVAFPAHGGALLVRLTVTRAALPLFILVAGHLAVDRPIHPRRMVGVILCGAGATVLTRDLGFPEPDVLMVIAVCVIGLSVVPARYRALVLVVAVLQPVTWPLPYTGYQPGPVVALLVIGGHLPDLARLGDRLPLWTAAVGRHPLAWYIGHLTAISGTAYAIRGGWLG